MEKLKKEGRELEKMEEGGGKEEGRQEKNKRGEGGGKTSKEG